MLIHPAWGRWYTTNKKVVAFDDAAVAEMEVENEDDDMANATKMDLLPNGHKKPVGQVHASSVPQSVKRGAAEPSACHAGGAPVALAIPIL